jgi:hypothetical protein
LIVQRTAIRDRALIPDSAAGGNLFNHLDGRRVRAHARSDRSRGLLLFQFHNLLLHFAHGLLHRFHGGLDLVEFGVLCPCRDGAGSNQQGKDE